LNIKFTTIVKTRPLAVINLDTSQIFGDIGDFAITYSPCPDSYGYEDKDKFAICYLVVKGNYINRQGNECWLSPWLYHLTDRKKQIDETRELLFPKEFKGLSDREIFELILKANQLEEEFHPDFLYLPQVDNEIWSRHQFELYETTDGYLSYFYVKDNKITFLIEDDTENEINVERSYKFIFHTVDLAYFINVINDLTNFLIKTFPFLEGQISSRSFNNS
jgi:hypothetical protein